MHCWPKSKNLTRKKKLNHDLSKEYFKRKCGDQDPGLVELLLTFEMVATREQMLLLVMDAAEGVSQTSWEEVGRKSGMTGDFTKPVVKTDGKENSLEVTAPGTDYKTIWIEGVQVQRVFLLSCDDHGFVPKRASIAY